MKKILAILLMVVISLNAVTVTMEKNEYTPQENLRLTLVDMPLPLNDGDWVGIFPKDVANDFNNALSWKHDGAVNDGTYILNGVDIGIYEARVFLNNSHTLLAKTEFEVKALQHNVVVTTSQPTYTSGQLITVTVANMPGNEGDWIGIYPKVASNEWENALSWKHDGEVVDGTYQLNGVPNAGTYEVRVFLNNSFTLLSKIEFEVEEIVHNTTITTSEATYSSGMPIIVTVSNMPEPENDGDWIGIFAKDAASEWANVLSWKHDGAVNDGTYTLNGVEAGIYEARVFLNNSYTLLAQKEFTVQEVQYATTVTTSKAQYETGDLINITLTNMPDPENDGDWVGIFEKDSENVWENAQAWKHDGAVNDGTYDLRSLPVGEYEVRVFLNNSFTQIAESSFTVIEKVIVTTIESDKEVYENGEDIVVTVTNMMANQRDWIGIFPAGAANEFEKAYDWSWTNGFQHGSITFVGLPAGAYEIRAFFNDGFEPQATTSITVTHVAKPKTVFEDAEDGVSGNWIQAQGDYPPRRTTPGFNSTGTLVLTPQWRNNNGNWTNNVEYHLPMDFLTQPILEIDIGGLPNERYVAGSNLGYMPHFFVGVYVKTQYGDRVMIWDSWFNHIEADAHMTDYGNGNIWMHYPSPVEHVRGWYAPIEQWDHFLVDIEQQLKILEPDNNLVYIEKFIATGGFLDNISLADR